MPGDRPIAAGDASALQRLLPEGWQAPVGYANGIAVDAGRLVFVAGQVGWSAEQRFENEDLAPQFEQALRKLDRRARASRHRTAARLPDHGLLLRQAGVPRGPARARRVWRRHMGSRYAAMSIIFIADLLDSRGKIELEATAVVPRSGSSSAAHRGN